MSKIVYDANSLDEEVGVLAEDPAEEAKLKKEQAKASADSEDEDEEEEEIEEPAAKKAKVKKEEPKEEEEEEEDTESEEESEEEESEEEEEDEDEEETESDPDLDEAIKSRFGKDYEINSIEDLEETLSALDKIVVKNEELTKELEDVRSSKTKLVFETPEQEKAYEFIKDMPKNRQGEGLQTWAELIQMDIDGTDPKLALRQQYVIKHPELTREEATAKFERDYSRKYTVKAEDFDDDKEREEEEKMRKIDLKSDSAKAKEFLKKEQQNYKAKDTKQEDSKVSEVIAEGIAKTTREATAFLKEFKHIEFDLGNGKFKFVLTEDKHKQLREAVEVWTKNPASYDAKGKLQGFDPEESTLSLTFAMFYKDIIPELISQTRTKTAVRKIEELSEAKPTRKAKGGSASNIPKSEDEQIDELIKAKESKRK